MLWWLQSRLEQFALDHFTEFLCQRLTPILNGPCPAAPQSADATKTWFWPLGGTLLQKTNSLEFSLGTVAAGLSGQCQYSVDIGWSSGFTLTYSNSKGFVR